MIEHRLLRHALCLAIFALIFGCGNDQSPTGVDSGAPADPGVFDQGKKPDLKLIFDFGKELVQPQDTTDVNKIDHGGDKDTPDLAADMETGDEATGPDEGTAQPIVEAGDIIFTEILLNPPGPSDAKLEAVELYNTTDHQIDINGWVLSDDGSDHTVLDACGSIVIQPKGYVVLSRSQDWVAEGIAACEYGGFILSNTEDEAILSQPGGVVVDAVRYSVDKGFPKTDGASIQLDPGAYDHLKNDIGANWCISTKHMAAPGPVILGATLGTANDECETDCTNGCDGRECGCDECGNPCGSCPRGFGCNANGKCVQVGDECIPKMEQAGCPGCECEACVCAKDDYCCNVTWDEYCVTLCENECEGPSCSDTCQSLDCFLYDRECGPDGCCGSCGECAEGSYCKEPEGRCAVCTCDGKDCGDDGCGVSCGKCDPGVTCADNLCQTPGCTPTELPGCDGCQCEACVCGIDAFCCDTMWDSMCVGSCVTDCGQACKGQE